MDPSDIMIEHLIEVAKLRPSSAPLEQPTLRPLLNHHSPVQQPANPLPKRDTTSIAITDGQAMPPVPGFPLEVSKQGDHYERVWVCPSFIPEVQQALQ